MADEADNSTPEKESQNDDILQGERISIVQEFCLFLTENKAYWLAPIFIVLLLMILLVVAGGTGAAPFIYTLF